MKITAITRFKHAGLYAALKQLGWSQAELARRTGFSNGYIGNCINMVKRPLINVASKIQTVLGEMGIYIDVRAEWPEVFEGLKHGYHVEQTAEVEMESLEDHPEVLELPAPEIEANFDTELFTETVERVISRATPYQKDTFRRFYYGDETPSEIADRDKVSRNCVGVRLKSVMKRIKERSHKFLPFKTTDGP